MSGLPDPPRQVRRLRAGRPAGGDRRAVPDLLHLYRRGGLRERQHLHAVFDRRRGARRRVAVRRQGQRDRRDLRRAGVPHHRRPAVRVRFRPAVAAAVPGRRAACRRQHRLVRACSACATSWSGSNERGTATLDSRRLPGFLRALDPAVATAFACILLLLLFGSLYSTSFLSPEYLLQQLKVASFLGVIATGMMMVILLGQIDLSVPWVVAVGGMMSSAAAAYGTGGVILAIPFGIFCGVADRPRQRHRRRLSAHPLDDHHARHQCRRARADGRLHRRLLAAGFRLARRCATWRPASCCRACRMPSSSGR